MIIGKCPVCGEDMRIGSDMTNADRIRSMTDEELAKWLESAICPHDKCPDVNAGNKTEHCVKCWLDWLKEEVKDGI